MNLLKKLTIISLVAFAFLSFTQVAAQQRVEGQVLNFDGSKAIETDIVISREGQTWQVKSDKTGKFSISLPSNQAYAIKVYDANFKNYVSAVFLDGKAENLECVITLQPKK
jgi:hypothetical protein